MQHLQQDFGLGVAEIPSSAIPYSRLLRIVCHPAQTGPLKKSRIERLAQPQGCHAVSRIGATLIEKARGHHVTGDEKGIAARQQRLSLGIREHRLISGLCRERGRSDWW
jgi:hypothetical protein